MALYVKHLGRGVWRWIYVTTALAALYFNVFVLIVQSFQKVPALQKLAPTQSEPPFSVTQGVVLVAFLVLGTMAARGISPWPVIAHATGRSSPAKRPAKRKKPPSPAASIKSANR